MMNILKSSLLNSYKKLVNRRRLLKKNPPVSPHHKLIKENIYCKEESKKGKIRITVSLYSNDGINTHRWQFWHTGWKSSKSEAWDYLNEEIEKLKEKEDQVSFYKQVKDGNQYKSIEL